ncbi:MAG TPA: hypothetical protein VF322_01905, partial [Gammaproteobacteria bacterium]
MTRKALSRRQVLRGAGAAVALPFLSAMWPAATAFGRGGGGPKRFGVVFVPHGERPGYWTPA